MIPSGAGFLLALKETLFSGAEDHSGGLSRRCAAPGLRRLATLATARRRHPIDISIDGNVGFCPKRQRHRKWLAGLDFSLDRTERKQNPAYWSVIVKDQFYESRWLVRVKGSSIPDSREKISISVDEIGGAASIALRNIDLIGVSTTEPDPPGYVLIGGESYRRQQRIVELFGCVTRCRHRGGIGCAVFLSRCSLPAPGPGIDLSEHELTAVHHADAKKIRPFAIRKQRVQNSALVDNHGGLNRLNRRQIPLPPDRVKVLCNDLLNTQRLGSAEICSRASDTRQKWPRQP